MQINLTTYYIYGSKKKQTQTFPIVIMATRKNKPTPTTYCTYNNTKKMNNY